MESVIGKNIKVTIFGGSHEPEIGCIIQGFPMEAMDFDHEKLQHFLDLRAPGNSPFATKRKEPDHFEIRKADPLTLIIRNRDQRSGDYKQLESVPRPGHADYTARLRYGNRLNMSGGGPFSARMTAPLCIAGGLALQFLEGKGVRIGAHLLQAGRVCDIPFDPMEPDIPSAAKALEESLERIPALDPVASQTMADEILKAREEGDSIGGVVEVAAAGIPAGIGGAMYDGLESLLAPIYFGIPAVKGVEFGAGFAAAEMSGSENNDAYIIENASGCCDGAALRGPGCCCNAAEESRKRIKTKTNNAGGILGGITTGMPFVSRIAFKPTPSISKMQESVNLDTMENTELSVKGRHDPCVAVRAVPIVIAATALGLLDAWQGQSR